jgi:hypothetical protein
MIGGIERYSRQQIIPAVQRLREPCDANERVAGFGQRLVLGKRPEVDRTATHRLYHSPLARFSPSLANFAKKPKR